MLFLIISMCTLCSGEKIQDIVCLKTIEIKGRVKWGDLKNLLKDLHHPQNCSIMVRSLSYIIEHSSLFL